MRGWPLLLICGGVWALTACAAPPPPTSTPQPLSAATPSILPDAAQAHSPGVSDEWQSVYWQNITIPIPPRSVWNVVSPNPSLLTQTRTITASYILPEQTSQVLETPTGPGFYILEFSGSLDRWVQQVQDESARAGQPLFQVAESYDLEIAHRPAKAYPPLISGLSGHAEMYVLRIDNTRILLIWVEDSTSATTSQILGQLTIDE